jgi:long-subunit fatty acid transport protein
MKKIIYLALLAMGIVPASAQDTYETARLLGGDLNGTARYVGMGGALEALGADISTISTNPAGIGLFRHSTVSASLGLVSQEGVNTFDGLSKTNMSFDQAGFVYALESDYGSSFLQVAFNYHKSHNFDQILSAEGSLKNASLNALTYAKDGLGSVRQGGFYLAENKQKDLIGWEDATSDYRARTFSQLDYLNANAVLLDPTDGQFYYSFADGYSLDRAHRGWIGNYDISLSGNIKDRVYLGFTLGIHSVTYTGYSEYVEHMLDGAGNPNGHILYQDEHKIDGSGFDVKFGAIFRPIEESPFRVGLYVHTPTWYSLESRNHTEIFNKTTGNDFHGQNAPGYDSYEFKFYTPWKFGVSLGHTISDYLAIGATYEYTDNSSADIREYTGYVDEYDNKETESDRIMNRNVEKSLKGVSTLKVGTEVRIDPSFAVRLGYNYVSPMYSKSGMRDSQLDSYGVMYSSTADYTNWKSTNRLTCGLGYRTGNVNIDLAYQYSATKGDCYPFQQTITQKDMAGGITTRNDFSAPTKVDFKRHQVLLTLGYTF